MSSDEKKMPGYGLQNEAAGDMAAALLGFVETLGVTPVITFAGVCSDRGFSLGLACAACLDVNDPALRALGVGIDELVGRYLKDVKGVLHVDMTRVGKS